MAHGPRIERSGWIFPGRPWGARHAGSDETPPSFELLSSDSASGIANLDRSLEIESTAVDVDMLYFAVDVGASTWTAQVGNDATKIAGTPLLDQGSPWLGSNDTSVYYDSSGYYRESTADRGNPGTNDWVLEFVVQMPRVTPSQFGSWAAKRQQVTLPGWIIYHSNTAATIQIQVNGGLANNDLISATLPEGAWYHGMAFFCTSTNNCRMFLNGLQVASATYTSGQNVTSATGCTLGADGNNTLPCEGGLSYLALWHKASWFTDANQSDVALRRLQKLAGMWPSLADGTEDIQLFSRTSNATMRNWNGSSYDIYEVGPRLPRVERWCDSDGTTLDGYNSEVEITNSMDYSEDFDNAAWTKTRATISSNGKTAPNGLETADGIIGSALNNTHRVDHAGGTTAGTHVFSCFVAPGAQDWVEFETSNVANGWAFFDVANGVLGSTGAGALASYIDGPYTGGFYRCTLTYAAVSAAHTHYITPAESDGDTQFSGDGSTVDIWVWGAQHEISGHVNPHSYVPALAASATRVGDFVRYKGDDGNLGGVGSELEGYIECKMMTPVAYDGAHDDVCVSLNDGGSSLNRVELYVAGTADNKAAALVRSSDGGGDGDASGAGNDISDGKVHTIACAWATNSLQVSSDGLLSTEDTVLGVPNDLDRINPGADYNADEADMLVGEIKIYSMKRSL